MVGNPVATMLQREKLSRSSTLIKCLEEKKMCCAKSDEFPVTVLHGFYVDSSLKKCFCKFIAEGYLMNVGFCQVQLQWQSNYWCVLLLFRRGVKQVHILVHFPKGRSRVQVSFSFRSFFGTLFSILFCLWSKYIWTDAVWRMIPKNTSLFPVLFLWLCLHVLFCVFSGNIFSWFCECVCFLKC